MNFIWICQKCKKEYPANGDGLVFPIYYSALLSTRLEYLRCVCGGDVDLRPN